MKIIIDGQPREAEIVNVTSGNEKWNEYLLADGNILKVKLVLTKVIKCVDFVDKDGVPVYQYQSSNVVTIIPGGN
jgi:hypothetical protein